MLEQVIDLALDIAQAILKSYNGDIKRLLPMVGYHSKLVLVIRVYSPLVEEGCTVNDGDVRAVLNCGNDVSLERYRVDVKEYCLIEGPN